MLLLLQLKAECSEEVRRVMKTRASNVNLIPEVSIIYNKKIGLIN